MRHGGWAMVSLMGAGLALLAAGARLRAQEARDLTVEESVRMGLEQNALLKAADADARAARAGYAEARAGALPSIRSQASYTRLSNNIPPVAFTLPGTDSTFTFQAVELNRWDAEVTLEQPIFSGFRVRNEMRAAARASEASALTAEQARADVALEIRSAYWNLYRALAVRDALDTSLGQVEEHLKDVRNHLEAGTALRRDVLAAETRRSEVQLERVAAANDVRVGQLELSRLIGLPLDTPVRPASDVTVEGGPGGLDSLSAAALSGRPDLAAQAAQVQGLQARLRAAQGGRLPELSFVARYLYSRPNPYFFEEQDRFHYSWELGFSARWSLWEGGRIGAQTAEARARLVAAEARLADARARVEVDVARQRLEVVRSGEAVQAAASNVASAEESFRVARQQYEEGVALSSEVLDAEEAYRHARSSRAGALADYAIARATLLDVLGRVW